MAVIERYPYKTVTRKWDCEGFLERIGFEPVVVKYSTSAMRHYLVNAQDPELRIVATRCVDLSQKEVAQLINDVDASVRISLLENFHIFEYNFDIGGSTVTYEDLIQIAHSGRIKEARALACHVNFTFYPEELQQCLLDYNDPVIDSAMISCDVTLESLIELSHRKGQDIALWAQGTLSYLLEECIEWSCDRLTTKIKGQFKLEGNISAMSETGEGFRVQFTESISGRVRRYFAEYQDRQWKLALFSY